MSGSLPLPSLLSQALVAFTVEIDNEAERRIPHTTSDFGTTADMPRGPWLTSMAMYGNCLEHLDDAGLTVGELERRARTGTNLDGMRRWGYITVGPDPADPRAKPPRASWVVRPTPAGRASREIWRPLFGTIEKRWRNRFGDELVERLREALHPVVGQLDPRLPDCLPILGYGLQSKGPDPKLPPPEPAKAPQQLPLSALLSKTLLAFAIEFESESAMSLAICANVLRVVDETGVRVKDLPVLSGVSKESISMAMGILRKFGLAVEEKDRGGRPWKVVRLTALGMAAKDRYRRVLSDVETGWQERFGAEAIRRIREPLEELVGDQTPEGSPLFECLEPPPSGWRAQVRRPETLPHYPMVLHRGGYPDGS